MTKTPLKSYGFLLDQVNKYGTDYVRARLVVREGESLHPVNPRTGGEHEIWDAPKFYHGLAFDGLGIDGFLNHDGNSMIGFMPEYRDVYAIDISLAEKQVKTLKRIHKQIQADHASEPGDILVSMAKALKLSFVVKQVGTHRGSGYKDNEWVFLTIPEGRNILRTMNDALVAKKKAA